MLFNTWSGLFHIIVVGTTAYVALIVLLRLSGKRALSKMNAFDLVVTVALGSTFSTVLLDRSISLAEGVLALSLLISLQYVITWLSVRSKRFQALVKSEPTLLVRDGTYLTNAMRNQRVSQEEILSALRLHGVTDVNQAVCVILETDGSLSVISDNSFTR